MYCRTPRTLSSSSCTLTTESHRLRPLCLHSSIGPWLSSAPCPLVKPPCCTLLARPRVPLHHLSHKRSSKPLSCNRQLSVSPYTPLTSSIRNINSNLSLYRETPWTTVL